MAGPTKIEHPSVEEREARGKSLRAQACPPATPGGSRPRTGPTRYRLLEAQNASREPDLVPVRHGRMMVSPFTFYRGAAKIMAADLEGHADGPGSTCSSAVTRTSRTSACSPRPSGRCCSA